MTPFRLPTLLSLVMLIGLTSAVLVSLQVGERPETPRAAQRHPMPPPFLMFRALAPRAAHGQVALLPLARDVEPDVSSLACVRLHYAGGRGVCIVQESSAAGATYAAFVFDHRLTLGPRLALDGVPTRVRVAPDGRRGAITTYAEEERPEGERLVTRTRLIDMRTAQVIADLDRFRVDNRNLPPISGPIDLAGVAFERDGDRFFATLSSATTRYLVAGSVGERRLTTLRTGVANEALSPDGRRLAVKRLLPERGVWQVAVIDLATWAERDLPHADRRVDDQVEWLDEAHVLFHDVDGESTSLWALAADGQSGPRVVVRHAYSGVVQR